jgi:hypothetical protein
MSSAYIQAPRKQLKKREPGTTEDEAPSSGHAIMDILKVLPNTNGGEKATTSGESKHAEAVTQSGMECDIKNLYQKEDERGRTSWTDKYPDNLDEAAENERTAKYAILVRNKKSFDSRKKLEIDSIVVQSPLLKVVLSKVLKDYPG